MARSSRPRRERLPEPLEVRPHPTRTLVLLLTGLVMTGLAAALIVVETPWGVIGPIVGWIGTATFGAATLYVAWRLVAVRGPVISMSEAGFHDTRVTHDVVPWRDISGATTWTYNRQTMMLLVVRPDAWDRLPLTRAARWSRNANLKLGADGLAITSAGLTVSHDELLVATRAWIAATH